ncbi:MAG: glucose 1-dehydrogenase [Chloroflexi bacterium]|nr:glucose 1-dehydrogenase [Chloroflexota bacterium]
MDASSTMLKDKVAIVTGGGDGIGKGIALTFARFGADVVIADRNQIAGEQVAEEVRAVGRRAEAMTTDIRDFEQVKAMVARTVDELGGVDILVNNAGGTRHMAFLDMGEAGWRKHIDLNLMGLFNCTDAAVRAMIDGKRQGSIINISSIEGMRAAPMYSVYAACKAGMLNFTRSMALELADHGIRVNAIAPDFIGTPHTMPSMTPERIQGVLRGIPLGRIGSVEDVAGACVYLCSDLGAWTTGITISVDGTCTVDAMNFTDATCMRATQEITKTLAGKTIDERVKPEARTHVQRGQREAEGAR